MKILKLVLPLTIIAAICAAVLSLVNDITKAPIANIATLKANAAAKAVLPEGVQAIDTKEDPADNSIKVFVGYADADRKVIAGYAVPGVSGAGYGGDIKLMVGLTPDRKIVSYQVLAANETPGLGAKLGDKGVVKLCHAVSLHADDDVLVADAVFGTPPCRKSVVTLKFSAYRRRPHIGRRVLREYVKLT